MRLILRMVRLTIDNQTLDVPDGTTILDAAWRLGIVIPTLCHWPKQKSLTSCFLCVVNVSGHANLLPACAAVCRDGMVVDASSPEVLSARRTCLELLLSDHVGDCIAPCQAICPAGMDIPRMVRDRAAGRTGNAMAVARKTLALPGVLGYICPAPCEKGCRRAVQDQAIAIASLHRPASLADVAPVPARQTQPLGKSVAIVGAGPAGLSAAWRLLRAGAACTIIDDHPSPGGALRYAVAADALPRWLLDAEIDAIRGLGVELRLNTRVGVAVSLAELREQFDAVILAVGRSTPEALTSLGLADSDDGTLSADPRSRSTVEPGVFAAGDVLRAAGSHMAVRSVGEGAAAAASALQHIQGRPVAGLPRRFSCHIGPLKEGEIAAFMEGVRAEYRQQPAEFRAALSAAQAVVEAARCLHCDCRKAAACRLRDACDALGARAGTFQSERRRFVQDRRHARLIYESGKCIACGLCVQIAAEAGEALGLTFIGRGFDVRVAVPLGESLAKALDQAADRCVEACPTAALVWKDDGE